MANAAHLKILKEGIEKWNQWRRNKRAPIPNLNGANLSGEELREANLAGAMLKDADLSEANLAGADLNRAELNFSKLSDAYLTRADLRGADLSGAILVRSDLFGAILSGANLGGSILWAANLSDAELSNSSFDKAILWLTVFGKTSLKSAYGLESCVHQGPSIIDFHTLMASGPLPEVFLRGCGLSDEFIRYLPSFWNQPFQFYSCFISYSHADQSFAQRLHDACRAGASGAGATSINCCPARTFTTRLTGESGFGTSCCSAPPRHR